MTNRTASLTNRRARRAPGLGRPALAAAIAAALGLTACNDGGRAADATLSDAGRDLAALNVGGMNPPSDKSREAVYAKVVRAVQPITAQGLPSQQAAAKRLLAIAQEGQGQIHLDRALEASRVASDMILAAQSLLDRRQGQLALADALAGYDPAAQRESLKADDAARQKDLAAAQAKQAAIEKELDGLRAEADAHRADAKRLREQEGAARARALDAAPADRLAIVEEAVKIQRQADEADRQASLTSAQIDRKAPELESMKREVERIEKQREFLALALRQTDTLAAVNTDQAADNRKVAGDVAEELAKQIGEIRAEVQGAVSKEFDASIKSLESAERSLRGASGQGAERTSSQLAIARVRQALADAHQAEAHAWSTFAALLDRAASAKPRLIASAEYAQAARDAEATAQKAAAAAAESFGQAAEALASAGGRGEMADRLQRTADKLKALQAKSAGAPAEGASPAGQAQPEQTGSPAPAPSQAGGA